MSACVFCNTNVTSRQHALLNSVVDVVIRTIDILLHFIFQFFTVGLVHLL